MSELIPMYILLFIVTAVLLFLIIRGLLFKRKFNKTLDGMSYNDVVSLIGYPKNSDRKDGTLTCIWRVRVLRDIDIIRVIVFKNDKVYSVTNG